MEASKIGFGGLVKWQHYGLKHRIITYVM